MQEAAQLLRIAQRVRREIIEAIYQAGSGHPGGSLSGTDILVALYFGGILKLDPKKPKWQDRDRFILSCGHEAPAWYAVLKEAGYRISNLGDLRNLGTELQGHPTKVMADFVETTTGSLGQGLGVGVGIAVAIHLKTEILNVKTKDLPKVVVMCSDGEQDEGSHWEAVAQAGFRRLGNLNLIIDKNGMQLCGETREILDLEPLEAKYKAFGWEVLTVNGHDFEQLLRALSRFNEKKTWPTVVIAQTIRGKGVAFMENSPDYHAKTLTEEEYRQALRELEEDKSLR